jgi:hypothetical protein
MDLMGVPDRHRPRQARRKRDSATEGCLDDDRGRGMQRHTLIEAICRRSGHMAMDRYGNQIAPGLVARD